MVKAGMRTAHGPITSEPGFEKGILGRDQAPKVSFSSCLPYGCVKAKDLLESFKVVKGFLPGAQTDDNLSGTADEMSVSKVSLRRLFCLS
jgi:hypothetical protein